MAGPSDATKARYVKSYEMRRGFVGEVQYPPAVPGVLDAIDIHCHAHEGQQDALAVAKHASKNGMRGILYKTIVGRSRPMDTIHNVEDDLARWCETEDVEPIKCWAGYNVAPGTARPSLERTREALDSGVSAVWMPVAMHANTLMQVGGKKIWWGASKDPTEQVPPMPWEDARNIGHFLLDDHGRLEPEIRDIIHLVGDRDAALFFGHATHPEIHAMAEEVEKLGFRRAVIDHPFSPFVDLDVEQMQQMASAGIYLNFTYDELSPLLGVDPFAMYQAIRAVGTEHVTLSSDAGEPLFPNSVECMRLMRAYMGAFGLTAEEIHEVTTVNPGRVVEAS
jgi:hypothetical protein